MSLADKLHMAKDPYPEGLKLTPNIAAPRFGNLDTAKSVGKSATQNQLNRIKEAASGKNDKGAYKYWAATQLAKDKFQGDTDVNDEIFRNTVDNYYDQMREEGDIDAGAHRGDNFLIKLGQGIRDGLDFVNQGIGEGLNFVFDNTIGNLPLLNFLNPDEEEKKRQSEAWKNAFSGHDAAIVPDLLEDIALSTIGGPAGIGLVAAKNLAQRTDDITGALSGRDYVTQEKLGDAERLGKGLSSIAQAAFSATPGIGKVRLGQTFKDAKLLNQVEKKLGSNEAKRKLIERETGIEIAPKKGAEDAAEEAAEKTAGNAAEEAAEKAANKTAKEVAEDTAEQTAEDVAEAARETAAREAENAPFKRALGEQEANISNASKDILSFGMKNRGQTAEDVAEAARETAGEAIEEAAEDVVEGTTAGPFRRAINWIRQKSKDPFDENKIIDAEGGLEQLSAKDQKLVKALEEFVEREEKLAKEVQEANKNAKTKAGKNKRHNPYTEDQIREGMDEAAAREAERELPLKSQLWKTIKRTAKEEGTSPLRNVAKLAQGAGGNALMAYLNGMENYDTLDPGAGLKSLTDANNWWLLPALTLGSRQVANKINPHWNKAVALNARNKSLLRNREQLRPHIETDENGKKSFKMKKMSDEPIQSKWSDFRQELAMDRPYNLARAAAAGNVYDDLSEGMNYDDGANADIEHIVQYLKGIKAGE